MFRVSRKLGLVIVVLMALMALGLGQAWAASYAIENWDFEANNPQEENDGGWSVLSIDGWTIDGLAGTFDATKPGSYDSPSSRVAWINSGSILQTLTDPLSVLTAGSLYTLTVDVGNRWENYDKRGVFPGYSIQLLAGGEVLPGTSILPIPDYGTFATATLTYLALSDDPLLGQQLGIRLITDGIQTNFDNVHLTTTPEPTTLLLLGSGLLGLVALGRKKCMV